MIGWTSLGSCSIFQQMKMLIIFILAFYNITLALQSQMEPGKSNLSSVLHFALEHFPWWGGMCLDLENKPA